VPRNPRSLEVVNDAREIGDSSRIARAFKRYVGVPPGAIRRAGNALSGQSPITSWGDVA
jgi:AraC-like DNA-binding protein